MKALNERGLVPQDIVKLKKETQLDFTDLPFYYTFSAYV
jgi:hypothetical protein